MKKRLLALFFATLSFLGFSQPGAALNFDGLNDYVNLPNVNAPFDVSASHVKTFQVWFKNTSTQGSHVRIFSTGTANWTTGIWFGYASGSPFLRFELSDGILPSGIAITGTTNIRGDNQWHQATGVINGSVAILYLDAVMEGTVNISGEGAMNSAGSVHIGNSYDNEGLSNFRGDIDELRVWDKVLCQPEIMATMNCELTGSEFGLVAYYRFNQGMASANNSSVITLPDLTSNANNGTLVSFSLNGATSNWTTPGGVVSGFSCTPGSPCQTNAISTLTSNEKEITLSANSNQFEINSEENIIEVNVFDLTGKLILSGNDLYQHSFKCDLNSQTKGLYFIRAKLNNSKSKTFKVIVQ